MLADQVDFELKEPRWVGVIMSLASFAIVAFLLPTGLKHGEPKIIGAVTVIFVLFNYRTYLYQRTSGRVVWGKNETLYYRTPLGKTGEIPAQKITRFTTKDLPGKSTNTLVEVEVEGSKKPVKFTAPSFKQDQVDHAIRTWLGTVRGDSPELLAETPAASENPKKKWLKRAGWALFILAYVGARHYFRNGIPDFSGVGRMEKQGKWDEAFKIRVERCDRGDMDECSDASNNRLRAGDSANAQKYGEIACASHRGAGCYNLACSYCLQGKTEEALTWLKRSYELKKDTDHPLAANDPEKDPDLTCLYADPRFQELVNQAKADLQN